VNNDNHIKLYQSDVHSCNYLDAEESQVVFLDPQYNVDALTYSELNRIGFRRSGKHFYKPECPSCIACLASRISTLHFSPSRAQKRILKNNRDLQRHTIDSIIDFRAHYELFEKYIQHRHADGDMYPTNEKQFKDFIQASLSNTQFTEYRLNDRLISVSVNDQLDDGLSAIYTYFDPGESRRSLGTYAILDMINTAKNQQLPFVYLGYWIEASPKMAYKSLFKPLELFANGHWQPLK